MDRFLDVAQAPHATRSGPCLLPIVDRDAARFGVFYRVSLARARELMGDDRGVEPWPILGAAVAVLYVWEHRDSSVGAHGEVGLGIQARRRGARPSLLRLGLDTGAQADQALWVAQLPVNTHAARDAGVDLWGFPHYVTDISTRFDDDVARVRLGRELELSIGRLGGPTLRGQPVVTYSGRSGRLLRTCIDVDRRVTWGTGRSAELRMIGGGPLADAAHRLGLEHAPRLAAFRSDGVRALLPAGLDLGPLR
jgi:hypothetical protein